MNVGLLAANSVNEPAHFEQAFRTSLEFKQSTMWVNSRALGSGPVRSLGCDELASNPIQTPVWYNGTKIQDVFRSFDVEQGQRG